ncbi:MAG: hypothetical protein JNM09_07120 [Blastocatellia bacterium]|nr:hypothetical protein [Blastocatellia bacterium]
MGKDYWESRFAQQFSKVENKQKPGVLLSLIPGRDEWPEFRNFVRQEWRYEEGYYSIRRERPHCFIALLGGVAFYEYEEHRFWPYFAQQVGGSSIPASKQHEINADFVRVALQLGLKMLGTDYVGSAVYQIGIPLSLWQHFLRFCEWAWSNEEWEEFSSIDWEKAVEKRIINIPRLRNFLLGNRSDATTFTREILDARRILSDDEKLTINDLKQASLLRQEYFDEVPETAEFLRPSNPDSLFQNRARLYWDEGCINLHLPAVANDKLPATWRIDHIEQRASTTPDSLPLDSTAFEETLLLTLQSGERTEKQRLNGLKPFGLWDAEREKFVNHRRDALPVGQYALISRDVLGMNRRGFDEDDNPKNEPFELRDGTSCYVTRLAPTEKSAEVSFTGRKEKISFRSGLKIEARIFAGQGCFAANFSRYQQWIKVERLPLLCLAIPYGSFENPGQSVQQKFTVLIGEEKVEGQWKKQHEDDAQEFYIWNWENEPQLKQKVTIAIQAKGLGSRFEYQIEMLQSKLPDHCWQNLPGAFLPMVLLAQPMSQMKDGMLWQDLLSAREAITPDGLQVSRHNLREYVNRGFLEYHGHRWRIVESRCKLESVDEGNCLMSYCGNPAILWGLFKYVNNNHSAIALPEIEVISLKGELPYLQTLWQARQIESVKKIFR